MKLLFCLAVLVPSVHAFPTGAGGCGMTGMTGVSGSHLNNPTTGSLEEAGFAFDVSGAADGFAPGETYDWTLSGGTFRGVLVRLETDTGSTVVMDTIGAGLQMAGVCQPPATGVTHDGNADKTEGSGSFTVDGEAAELTADVTVVVANGGGISEYYFSSFTLAAAAAPAETEAPVMAPVAMTEAPVMATEAPVAMTEAPVAATEAPVAMTESPVVPTMAPVETTEMPVDEDGPGGDDETDDEMMPSDAPSVGMPDEPMSDDEEMPSDAPSAGMPDGPMSDDEDMMTEAPAEAPTMETEAPTPMEPTSGAGAPLVAGAATTALLAAAAAVVVAL